jgi:hypothetical protein
VRHAAGKHSPLPLDLFRVLFCGNLARCNGRDATSWPFLKPGKFSPRRAFILFKGANSGDCLLGVTALARYAIVHCGTTMYHLPVLMVVDHCGNVLGCRRPEHAKVLFEKVVSFLTDAEKPAAGRC